MIVTVTAKYRPIIKPRLSHTRRPNIFPIKDIKEKRALGDFGFDTWVRIKSGSIGTKAGNGNFSSLLLALSLYALNI